ncbi:MAG: ECF transporter S component, partial [Clostridiales bacterium]|nr:ECF transporter S component [Clostridiales bacterium]
MSMFILFFFRAPVVQDIAASLGTDSPLRFAFLLVGVQGLIEAAICAVLGSAIARALIKYSRV